MVMIGLYVTKTAAGAAIVLITLTIELSVVLDGITGRWAKAIGMKESFATMLLLCCYIRCRQCVDGTATGHSGWCMVLGPRCKYWLAVLSLPRCPSHSVYS